ncbi:hypothetical protein Tco_0891411 [Tanacetum coccineum]|uniref:Reverse transcriptase domain-containing protein n=1 Tax=Tanacetum coccineum TaxID=301880 RepID=A0ABQ5C8V9_9ASTR
MFSPYRGPKKGLLSSLSKSLREIIATEKVARSFKQPPRMLGSRRSRDISKYCYFHEDHGHDTNDCRQLRSQIKEAVKSIQLSYLVKGIKKEKAKTSDSQRGEKKEKITTPTEAPILMINQEEACIRNNISKSPNFEGRKITFPPVMKGSNSSAPVVIKAKILGREVGWVHMDSGEKSWAIGEVLLEITIGDVPLSRSETLNFVIVSPWIITCPPILCSKPLDQKSLDWMSHGLLAWLPIMSDVSAIASKSIQERGIG